MLGTSGSSSLRLLLCFSSLEGKLETLRRLAQASAVSEKRILVVDDDSSLIRLIGEALRSRFHCEVDATPNPEYGFELALKKRYRVFVFDFSMPMIDGAMLFTLIGKVYNHVNPPIVVPPLILISGRGDEARAQELMKEAGVRGFLPKPYNWLLWIPYGIALPLTIIRWNKRQMEIRNEEKLGQG